MATPTTWSVGRKTITADTKIDILIPPKGTTKRTKLTHIRVTNSTTAHTLTVLRPLGRTTLSAAALAAQAVINLTADPGDYAATSSTADNLIATNDYLAIAKPDGTYHLGIVSSVATLAITLTANVPTGGFASGAKVFFFGIATDTDPATATAHPVYTIPVSGVTTLQDNNSFCESLTAGDPILIQENNATAAATVEYACGVYDD